MSNLDQFRALGISELTLSALERKGFEEPSPIQRETIPILLNNSGDIIGQAQTGTGKTAAFAIPILEKCHSNGHVQALVLSPTRELSIQIAEEFNSLKGERNLSICPVYGGQSIEIQLKRLREGVDIVIGTPGRIIDLLERRVLKIDQLRFAVLDEADEMLNMGFVEDIERIMADANPDKQMLMFSATMPPEIMKIAEKFMRDYKVISVKHHQLTTDLTEQIYFEVRREDKLEALSRIIDMEPDIYALVFCRTRGDVDELTEKLNLRGYNVEGLHGDVPQAQRTKLVERFKAKRFTILIATDVAARGIDVNNLTHVINYSIPQASENYVHRIGRTGRAGRQGTAITFVTPAEFRKLTEIKKATGSDIRREKLPTPAEIVAGKKARIEKKLLDLIGEERHVDYRDFAAELLMRSVNPEETLAGLLCMMFKDELIESTYTELEAATSCRRDRNAPKCRLFIARGKADGYGAKKILDLIYNETGIKSRFLGKIDCFDRFSFVDAGFEDAERIINAFRGGKAKSLLPVEMAKADENGGNGHETSADMGNCANNPAMAERTAEAAEANTEPEHKSLRERKNPEIVARKESNYEYMKRQRGVGGKKMLEDIFNEYGIESGIDAAAVAEQIEGNPQKLRAHNGDKVAKSGKKNTEHGKKRRAPLPDPDKFVGKPHKKSERSERKDVTPHERKSRVRTKKSIIMQ